MIVLAAGKGERLLPLTANTPKPLLDLGNGRTLAEEQIHRVQRSGEISEVIYVVGYLATQIEAKLATVPKGEMTLSIEYNPVYEITNNLISLWIARHWMDADFMVTNGDNLFLADVLKRFVVETSDGIWLAICPKTDFDEDDMKVVLDQGQVRIVSKRASPQEAVGESPGLALARGAKARSLFKAELDRLVRQDVSRHAFWLEVFNALYAKGVPVHPWRFDGSGSWQEVDFHMDLQLAKDMVRVALPDEREAA